MQPGAAPAAGQRRRQQRPAAGLSAGHARRDSGQDILVRGLQEGGPDPASVPPDESGV